MHDSSDESDGNADLPPVGSSETTSPVKKRIK